MVVSAGQDDLVERVARIIDPYAWVEYDAAIRPYVEGRGAQDPAGIEQVWYARTWTKGFRTVAEVHHWFVESVLDGSEPVVMNALRISLRKARAIAATMTGQPASTPAAPDGPAETIDGVETGNTVVPNTAAPDLVPAGWQRRCMYPLNSDPIGKVYQWEACGREEATGHFDKQPGYEYRQIFALAKLDADK